MKETYNATMLKSVLTWLTLTEQRYHNFLIDATKCTLPDLLLSRAGPGNEIVINLSERAAVGLTYHDDHFYFECSVNKVTLHVYVPYDAIVGYFTDSGFILWNHPATSSGSNDYRQQMVQLPPIKAKETLQAIRDAHKMNQSTVTEVDKNSPSYPFPEDRFADYNSRQVEKQETSVVEDNVFKGTPGGVDFYSRRTVKRERPTWLKVINGGKA